MFNRVMLTAVLTGLAASAASAADTYMNTTTVGNYGWNLVVVPDSGGRGSVMDRMWGTEAVMQFTNGNKDLTSRCWAAISTANYAGVSASSITSLKMRVYGIEGDGGAWQPPTFMLAFAKAPDNLSMRYAQWVPWADGTARASGSWQEYDAMTDGEWFIPWTGARYPTFAAMVAATPGLVLATDAQVTQMYGLASGAHSFNVGHFDWISNVNTYHDSARGVVDWFEVGVGGSATRFYLNEVPEPGTLAALAIGTCLIGIRRRRVA